MVKFHLLSVCFIAFGVHVITSTPRCSQLVKYREGAEHTAGQFELDTSLFPNDTFFGVTVMVSDVCTAYACTIKLPRKQEKIEVLIKNRMPINFTLLFNGPTSSGKVLGLFLRISSECKVLCFEDELFPSKRKSITFTIYPHGRWPSPGRVCDYNDLIFKMLSNDPLITPEKSALDGNDLPKDDETCGRLTYPVAEFSQGYEGFIEKGSWPWIAGIYVNEDLRLNFACSGSLISHTAVVISARCLYKGDGFHTPDNIMLIFGMYNLTNFNELDWFSYGAKRVVFHPYYNPLAYRNDIALIITNRHVRFTDFISAICIWGNFPKTVEPYISRTVQLVDWDRSVNKSAMRIPLAQVASLTDSYHLVLNTSIEEISTYELDPRISGTEDEFCNDKQFEQVFFKHSGRWVLGGTGISCNKVDKITFTLCTNIVFFVDWIKNNTVLS